MIERSLAQIVTNIVKRLNAMGVEIAARSRLVELRAAILVAQSKSGSPTHGELPAIACESEATSALSVIRGTMEQFDSRDLPTNQRECLRALLSDALRSDRKPNDIRGRDASSLLRVATLCMSAGLQVFLADPGIHTECDDVTFCIAATQIESANGFRLQIQRALQRIGRRRCPAILFVQLCGSMRHGDNDIAEISVGGAFAERSEARMRALVHARRIWLARQMLKTATVGLIVSDHDDASGTMAGSSISALTQSADMRETLTFASMEFDHFFRCLTRGHAATSHECP